MNFIYKKMVKAIENNNSCSVLGFWSCGLIFKPAKRKSYNKHQQLLLNGRQRYGCVREVLRFLKAMKGVNDECQCQANHLQTYPAMAFHQVHTILW